MLVNLKNHNNLTENNPIPSDWIVSAVKRTLEVSANDAIVLASTLKYIDRVEIEFAKAIRNGLFLAICGNLMADHGFLVENVRWGRFDGYLAVSGATFVRWKPTEA